MINFIQIVLASMIGNFIALWLITKMGEDAEEQIGIGSREISLDEMQKILKILNDKKGDKK